MTELSAALHRYGAPAHRLELALDAFASSTGIEVQVMATPTALFIGFEGGTDVRIVRRELGEVDLEKLVQVDEIGNRVARRELTPGAGEQALRDVAEAPARFGPWSVLLGHAMASGGAALVFGGWLREAVAATALGTVTGLLSQALKALPEGHRLFPFLAGLLTTFLLAGARGLVPLATDGVLLAALIVLLPGLTLTVSLTELATGHLLSGTTRLTSAIIVLVQLGFGLAVGGVLGNAVFGPTAPAAATLVPWWAVLVSLGVTAAAFTVLLKARPRDLGWIVVACVVAVASARLGTAHLGSALGGGLGALALTLYSNAVARWRYRPATVTLVPGILLLVPGSIGFRAVSALLREDVVGGVETAFTTLLAGTALAIGLILGNALLSPRRAL